MSMIAVLSSLIGVVALAALFPQECRAALPPGYDEELYCPPEHCLRRRQREPGFAGGRTSFNECLDLRGSADGVPKTQTPQAWGFKHGDEARQKLLDAGMHQLRCDAMPKAEKTCAAAGGCAHGRLTILVASASANTGSQVVRDLSAGGSVDVKALFRNTDSDAAKELAALPGVSLVKGDFDDEDSITAAVVGVHRALLVSGAFDYKHFERETTFIRIAADAGVEAIVRIATATGLTHAGTTCAYGRAHHGIESFAQFYKYPVVNVRSNWFFDNILGNAGEAKAAGHISWPCAGNLAKAAMVDPRDVASASALILTASKDSLRQFLDAVNIEVHGPELVSFDDTIAAIADAVGYPIAVNEVPPAAWRDALVGHGLPKVFAESFLNTVLEIGGARKSMVHAPQETSPLLRAHAWSPKHTVRSWAATPKVLSAFKK